jgi:hypothetical protein
MEVAAGGQREVTVKDHPAKRCVAERKLADDWRQRAGPMYAMMEQVWRRLTPHFSTAESLKLAG